MNNNQSLRTLHRILLMRSSHISANIRKISKQTLPFSTLSNSSIFRPSIRFAQLSSCGAMEGAGDEKPFTVYYEGLLQAQKDDSVLIIDVREQKEIDETGKLPGSIHIPMGNVTKVLNLPDEEFQKEFQKPKPNKETKIILSCRSGMRSATVQSELQKLGYEKAYNYAGGWSEWESKQK